MERFERRYGAAGDALGKTRGKAGDKALALHHDLATAAAGEGTDLLRKFISDRGEIRSRRVTRVTARQQRMLPRAIKDAREMAL
ncbi:30S ribosomal protein S18 [Streptomyces mirabilis]|uniref:30S ribosomal protein S18 n=1 Tax=Streptomyces mirabilis TaxID=68239 RepID=UPI003697685C